MIDPSLYSSRTEGWGTPPALFARLDRIFGFRLDACASTANAKCDAFFTRADDALAQDWAAQGRVWMNPPYGRQIACFMRKAYEGARRGALVVALVSARTDTRWWHDWVSDKADAIFLRGRLRYTNEDGREQSSAPFPSALVVYRPDLDRVCNARRDGTAARDADDQPEIRP